MDPFQIHKYTQTPHVEGSRLQHEDEDLSQILFDAIRGKHLVIEESAMEQTRRYLSRPTASFCYKAEVIIAVPMKHFRFEA